MSQHILLDRPDRRIVLGWDRPLQSFFGVVLVDEMAVDGWPCPTGLEAGRRPVATDSQAALDLTALLDWARLQIADELAAHDLAVFHLGRVIGTLMREQKLGDAAPTFALPACLTGARP